MPGTGLNSRQERFCIEYLIDCNATQAAIRAGYSEKTAGQIGERLLKKVEIQNRIAELMQERQSGRIATAEEVLETLTRALRREIQDDDKPTKAGDVIKAADLLGRRYQLYVERVELSGEVKVEDAKTRLVDLLARKHKPG